jgi:hypothetical protein
MSADYQLTPLSQVRPGMILSDVLLDKQGQVLLPKGAVLTANTIALLPRHGIEMLAIVSTGPKAPPPDPAAVEARLAHLFRHHNPDDDEDWATGVLHRYMVDYRLNREASE